ncbi:vitamin-D-receptor interacting mediator subunit 4-domain-containing protein [Nemania sp. FL0031]|nr:vitamin-D-receptor interacting mediator subunit 4-domain-containing protein [Nemania sp. FL0031]
MNKQLDSCFDRVEKALGTLIDSIAKYNPSTSQVEELGNADAQLSKGLQDLQTHQHNYQRILDLRAETAKYDTQIKDTLRLLANTRKELVHASATVFPDGPNYDIQYDELLSYAGRISRTTIPPVGAMNAISAAITESAAQAKSEAASAPETAATTPAGGVETPNGTTTAAATPQPQPQPPPPSSQPVANGDASQQTTTTAGPSNTDLPEPLATFLNPHSAYMFVPWPTEEQVRHGAVASLAYMADRGIEAEGYDPEAEKARKEAEDEERRQAEERERVEREEREQRMREEQARARAEREKQAEQQAESWRRGSVVAGGAPGAAAGQPGAAGAAPAPPPQPQPKAQFQFMGDDDDDDDD